ncbi:hypothetical protein M426DRAFT_62150 [Hypoxylon sp. CI-4A]|nr:hypothetical protein M426DRAFT_62150 [Hypoxylon sp. CI-4A]
MDENNALILQLLREDADEVMSAALGKGKQPEGLETDAQVSFRLFLEELQNAEVILNDQRMTRSHQQAAQLDGDVVAQSQKEEQVAQEDRNLSIALSAGDRPSETHIDLESPDIDDDDFDFIEKLSCIYITGIDGEETDSETYSCDETDIIFQPESSAWAASRPPRRTRRKRACEACGDLKHFAELGQAPCQHEYCQQCLTQLFRGASIDETLFPPRCCKQPIPLDRSLIFLDPEVVQQFRKKAVEFSTARRTYCHNRNCVTFIPQTQYVNDTAICDECGCRTCITCKNTAHDNDCPNDENLQQVIQLARDQGWQRCQNCWGMVELSIGCNHMTCRCGFQFCYICGARWKTCTCEHWDEHLLFERAVEIDARNGAHAQAPQEQRVQRVMDNLRINHECEHERWTGRKGPRRCEECRKVMPVFIYECRQCQIMACRFCRFHRL